MHVGSFNNIFCLRVLLLQLSGRLTTHFDFIDVDDLKMYWRKDVKKVMFYTLFSI